MILSAKSFSLVPAAMRAIALWLLLPIAGVLQAQNVPVVAGHFTHVTSVSSWEITVFAAELPTGAVIGWLTLDYEYDDGSFSISRHVDEPVEELVFQNGDAFLRAGSQFLALRDNGAGINALPDKFVSLYFVSSPPPLAVFQAFLAMQLSTGRDVMSGDLQIRD